MLVISSTIFTIIVTKILIVIVNTLQVISWHLLLLILQVTGDAEEAVVTSEEESEDVESKRFDYHA